MTHPIKIVDARDDAEFFFDEVFKIRALAAREKLDVGLQSVKQL